MTNKDIWCSVKKKYKLNVNFFITPIIQILIPYSLTPANIALHADLVKDIHNGYVFLLCYTMS